MATDDGDELPWCMLGDAETEVAEEVLKHCVPSTPMEQCNIEILMRRHWQGLQAYVSTASSDQARVNRAFRSSKPGDVNMDTFVPSKGYVLGQLAILSSQHRKMSSKAARERANAIKNKK